MEQSDFLLIFTMDVKTHSCDVSCSQLMSQEFEQGHHEATCLPCLQSGWCWGTWLVTSKPLLFSFLFSSKHSMVFLTVAVDDHHVLITTSRLQGGGLCTSRSPSKQQGDPCSPAAVPFEVHPWKSDVWMLGYASISFHHTTLLLCLCWVKTRLFFSVHCLWMWRSVECGLLRFCKLH